MLPFTISPPNDFGQHMTTRTTPETDEQREAERAAELRRRLTIDHHRAKRLARRDPSGLLSRNRNR